VVYLFYFGGSEVLTAMGRLFGDQGFLGLNGFMVGTLAVGVVSGAYQTEVIRSAYMAIPRGEIEARAPSAWAVVDAAADYNAARAALALPGMGNVWQQVLKESALISVTGLAEIMRMIHVGAGSTRLPFDFYITGFVLYLLLTTISGFLLRGAETWSLRAERRV